jgi:hypothetical protein
LGKNYPAHSGCCGIRGANHGNWCVDQFAQAGGAVVKISHNPPYIIQEASRKSCMWVVRRIC